MITYILSVMTLHCALAYQPNGNANHATPKWDCSPHVQYLEFSDEIDHYAYTACNQHMIETIRLMGKYSYRATVSCKRKGRK